MSSSIQRHDTNEQFRPANQDEQLAFSVFVSRVDIITSDHDTRVEQAVQAVERHTKGLAQTGMYPTVNIAELAEQQNIQLQEDVAMAADLVMYPYDMISKDPMPKHNEYIDTINSLNPIGKQQTPATNIDRIRAEVERAADAALAAYAKEGMNEMEAFLAVQAKVHN